MNRIDEIPVTNHRISAALPYSRTRSGSMSLSSIWQTTIFTLRLVECTKRAIAKLDHPTRHAEPEQFIQDPSSEADHRAGRRSSIAASPPTSRRCSTRRSKFFLRSNFLEFRSWPGSWRSPWRRYWSASGWGPSAGSASSRCRSTPTISASFSGDSSRTKTWWDFWHFCIFRHWFKRGTCQDLVRLWAMFILILHPFVMLLAEPTVFLLALEG